MVGRALAYTAAHGLSAAGAGKRYKGPGLTRGRNATSPDPLARFGASERARPF
jgi:hypothetical protein